MLILSVHSSMASLILNIKLNTLTQTAASDYAEPLDNFILVIFFSTYISDLSKKTYFRVLLAHQPYQELKMNPILAQDVPTNLDNFQ